MFQLDRVLLIVIEHFWISKLLNYVTWKLQLEKVYPVGQKIMAHFSSQNSIYYSLLHTTFVFQIQYSFYSTLAFIFQLQHSFLFNLDGRFLSSTFVFFKCNVHYLSLTFVFFKRDVCALKLIYIFSLKHDICFQFVIRFRLTSFVLKEQMTKSSCLNRMNVELK